ncbi:MAG: hypothetical protein ACXVCP_00195 [Bdellovibrio sp.]
MKRKLKLIRKTSKAITFLIVISCLAALAAGSQLLYHSAGSSKFNLYRDENGHQYYVKTLQDYDFHRDYSSEGGEQNLLVTSTKTVRVPLEAEGISGNVSWSVRKGQSLETPLWSRSETATELNVHELQPVLVTGLGGCCAEMTGYRLFDIRTGRILMSFNDFLYKEKIVQPISLEVPNSTLRMRYLGVLSQDSTRDRDFVASTPGKDAVLLIKYAAESLKQTIQVDMEVASGYAPSVLEMKIEKDPTVPNSDKIEIRDGDQVTLWNIDGSNTPAAISGVLLKIVLNAGNGDKVIRVPVKGDKFDLSLAQIPSGVSLRQL